MATFTRQPFAEIGAPRLQALQSAKNRQNAIAPNFASPLKPTTTPSTGKRQRAPDIYEDGDAENLDPSLFNSPTKKSKFSSDAGFVKPAAFSLFTTSPVQPSPVPTIRKALSSPSTTKSTPITNSRGSPKHKRIHAISKHRRASSSPFRRVDPPSFNQSSPALPFSIDAALSGTIQGYTPKPAVTATPISAPAPAQHVSTLDESMPKGWFFEIHEDTPEQEAANLMEHSASVLDISSDDDVETKKRNQDLERGKENIPPPDFFVAQPRVQALEAEGVEAELQIEEPAKRPRLRQFVQDAMDEDRRPLGDLPPSEFYGEGCDASSYVTVDTGIEKPSSLSRECDFNSCPTPEKGKIEEEEAVEVEAAPPATEDTVPETAEDIVVHVDGAAVAELPAAPVADTPSTYLSEQVLSIDEAFAAQQPLEAVVATS
ncbi:uncharacterized protein K460DRAFT_403229 [Cucurbitaria berberidis CBS 394.84]|uniref:Thymidylate kinase n=1 Tax=Cucurbitaria berberidis CBS 394.84 TaxID=1168544 RepID=A0A9P4GMH6_9PLEO|nr:uncharacterized protein K460DRAFT_403229 [Cucurbitaria berberidis CBS 394.84]KAF1847914.1 hypothetical protein K460DRAFT_403229 [Cucurbitaria berberidis CBS 394.84]